jgi:hypothetical protein
MMFGKLFGFVTSVVTYARTCTQARYKLPKNLQFPGLSHAPEWTRTTTDREVHKALNLARLPIPPRAQGGEYSPGV